MSERLKTVVVGVGSIGERHVRCLLATERTEVAICEPNAEVRAQVADRYGVNEAFDALEAVPAQQYDAAVIATPAPLHIAQAEAMVERGAHVLIEKPLSTTTAGIERLRAALAERQRIAAVAYPYRAHPALSGMHAAVASGRFGAPLQVTAIVGQDFPRYRPAFRQTYYRRRESGGGAIQDALTHVINAVEWFVGPTDRVVADAERLKLDGVEVEDTAHVLARNGRVLTCYSINQHQPANENSLTVVCEQGQARFEYHRNRWRWTIDNDVEWNDESHDDLARDDLFMCQANAFLDAATKGTRPLCTLDEGEATLHTVLAILASLDSRAWQQVIR